MSSSPERFLGLYTTYPSGGGTAIPPFSTSKRSAKACTLVRASLVPVKMTEFVSGTKRICSIVLIRSGSGSPVFWRSAMILRKDLVSWGPDTCLSL